MARAMDRVSDMRPYVERALKDEELRESLMSAFAHLRAVYNELLGDRGAMGLASRVANDTEVQDNLRTAIEDLRRAADRVQGKDQRTGRNTLLLATGVAVGVLFNPITGPSTRQWLKDRLFGPSDEFVYGGDGAASPQSQTPA
jgi:hypothetical protein